MKISFIVVCAENFKSLQTCLSSLIDQTYSPAEIEILVMDNSINPLESLQNKNLCDWMDSRIQYHWVEHRTKVDLPHVRHKRCLYTATEIGVDMARGEWLCFPNQDSYYAPVFVERMFAVAEADTSFLYCDIILGGPGHGYFPLSTIPQNCGIDKTCFMLRREWFRGFEGKHQNYELEDGYFVERLVARGIKTAKCVQPLVVHN